MPASVAAGMGSRVALRIFLLCAVCSLLPTLIIGVSVYTNIARAERAAAQKRLDDVAKSYGLLLNERLVEAEGVLLDIGERLLRGETSAVYRSDGLRVSDVESSEVALEGLTQTRSTHPERSFKVADERLTNEKGQGRPLIRLHLLVANGERAVRLMGTVSSGYLWNADLMLSAGTLLCVSLPGDPTSSCVGEEAARTAQEQAQAHWGLFLTPHFHGGTWQISAYQPTDLAEAGLTSVRRLFPWLALMALVLALLIGSIEVRRVHRPLVDLLAAFRSMARGRFVRLTASDSRNEYSRLGKAFNHLSSTLRRQFRLLSAFSRMDQEILERPAVNELLEGVLPRLPAMLDAEAVAVGLFDSPARVRVNCRSRASGAAPYKVTCASLEAAHMQLRSQWPELQWEVVRIDVAMDCRGGLFVGRKGKGSQRVELLRQAEGVARRLAVALRNEDREALLVRQAYFDALTDLPNRRLLCDRISQALAVAQNDAHGLALLYIDLDRFKLINDSFGHVGGDELLQTVARRFTSQMDSGDTVARLGGDEFIVLLANADFDKATRVAQRVLSELSAPMNLAGNPVKPQASVGIALFPADGRDAETLLANADAAMYRAKKQGGGRAVYFEESMNQRSRRRVQVERALRDAIECETLRLEFQPKIRTADSSWSGVEALMRWDDPELGSISPSEFIPIAEETGQVAALGMLALRHAARFAQECLEAGVPIGHVAVNVSALQLRDAEIVEYLQHLLSERRLPPALLQVEVTESSLMQDLDNAIELLARIRSLGVRVAIDDFGTGYSSLAALQRLPIDVLKIDRAFIEDIAQDPASVALIRMMISVAHVLGLQVVAEGVETAAQVTVLRQEGCDTCQGFYFGKAETAQTVMRLAAHWRGDAPSGPAQVNLRASAV